MTTHATPRRVRLYSGFGFNAQCGYYADREIGTYYCQARNYAPGQGRWLEPDPIGREGGMNLYSYCAGQPVGAIDPEGLERLIIGSNPGALGGHSPLGIERDGKIQWWSFYPNNGGKKTTHGSGYVSHHGPDPKVKANVFYITPQQYNDLQRRLQRSKDAYRHPSGLHPYDIGTNNCADWSSRMVHEGLGDDYPDYRYDESRGDRSTTTPVGFMNWTSHGYGGFLGTWSPGQTVAGPP